MQNRLTPTVASTPSNPREGVDIQFSEAGFAASEQWTMGGWTIQFIHLPANDRIPLETSVGRHFVKIITGSASNLARSPFAKKREIRTTLVTTAAVIAGAADTLLALFIETPAVPPNVVNMDQLTITGPNAEAFQWRTFEDRFGKSTNAFNGKDAYMSGGFHLLDRSGTEITYLNLWTAGKGVNLTTHNHAHKPQVLAPAFAETHWVFNNGTGHGAMYSATAADGPKTETYPMQRGDEHGPFFAINQPSKKPLLRENGAVSYPWHGWEAGMDDEPGQAYDVVAAFETNPKFVQL